MTIVKQTKGVKVMNGIVKSLFLIVLLLFSVPGFSLDFPLPDSNFVPAKMPMYPLYPRPDNDTQAHARHRWAHPDFRYEIPIGVQGGAWPFKYEIISGPSGSAIGEYYGDNNYGVLTWSPTTSTGNESFHIRVTDQELNTVDFNWNVTIDANQFVFIQDGWSGSKVGTIDSPLESFSDWYKNDRNDSSYHNKIIVFRGGNYTAVGDPSAEGNVRLDAKSKTPSLIGFPGEIPIIDCSRAKFFSDGPSNNLRDMFIAGLRFENARSDVANSHFFWAIGDIDRATFYNNYFYKLGNGTIGTDNPSAIFASGTDQEKTNILIKGNTFDSFTNNGSNGSYMDLYAAYYVLIEGNTAKNSNNLFGIWAKATKEFVTIRNNDLSENNRDGGIVVHYGDAAPGQAHDHEICWNKVVFTSTNRLALLIMGDAPSAANRAHYNSFIYRNTFVNGRSWVRFPSSTGELYKVDGNVVVSATLTSEWDTSIMDVSIPNVTGELSSNIVDKSGLLIGSYRSNYLGSVGHEVSGQYVKVPKSPVLDKPL